MTDNLVERFLEELGKEFKNKPVLPVGDPAVDRLPVVFVIDHSDSTRETGDIVQINEFLRRFADSVGHVTLRHFHVSRRASGPARIDACRPPLDSSEI